MIACILFALAAPPTDELPEGWSKFDGGEHAFGAAFPGEVKRRKAIDKDPNGNPVEVTFFQVVKDDVTYLVGISVFDDVEYLRQPKKKVFDYSRDGSLKRSKGKVVKESDVKLGKIEGRDFTLSIAQGGIHLRGRTFVANGKLYSMLIAARSEAETDSKNAKRFFDSFKIHDPAKSKEKKNEKKTEQEKAG